MSADAAPRSHRLLWLAIAGLFALVVGQGAVLVVHLRAAGSHGAGGSLRQDLSVGDGDVAFPQDTLDAIQSGRADWMEAFFQAQGVSVDKADVARGSVARYMMAVNEIRMMERKGIHPPEKSRRFYELERSRLLRALDATLGREVTGRLDQALSENGIQVP